MVASIAVNPDAEPEAFESERRLERELLQAATELGPEAVRFLVDRYYQTQQQRIATAAQARTAEEADEPNKLMPWLFALEERREANIRLALQRYAKAQPLGRWAMSITGIGPVITAGLLAHIDFEQCPSVGHIWRFAGLDPTTTWDKGQKRPWNAKLKRICWIASESFVKVQSSPNDVYGKVYAARKVLELERNERGDFAAQAAQSLSSKRYGADTVARQWYDQGKLPPARIHLRAERYAVKLFLSHFHTVGYWLRYQQLPPKPYAVQFLGHADWFRPPHLDLVPELANALHGVATLPMTAWPTTGIAKD